MLDSLLSGLIKTAQDVPMPVQGRTSAESVLNRVAAQIGLSAKQGKPLNIGGHAIPLTDPNTAFKAFKLLASKALQAGGIPEVPAQAFQVAFTNHTLGALDPAHAADWANQLTALKSTPSKPNPVAEASNIAAQAAEEHPPTPAPVKRTGPLASKFRSMVMPTLEESMSDPAIVPGIKSKPIPVGPTGAAVPEAPTPGAMPSKLRMARAATWGGTPAAPEAMPKVKLPWEERLRLLPTKVGNRMSSLLPKSLRSYPLAWGAGAAGAAGAAGTLGYAASAGTPPPAPPKPNVLAMDPQKGEQGIPTWAKAGMIGIPALAAAYALANHFGKKKRINPDATEDPGFE